jgi:hypothetical protein
MQSELKASEFIAEFTSGDAKDYAHWVITNEGENTVCKFRGITVNCHASKIGEFRDNQARDFGTWRTHC